ncbi:MAG: zinc-ribbon domain-containing protein [Streptosporangiales bacterium]|nr:zinc-ribbon domain-containing protein [Streptosporangiales bacterium]
MWGASTRSSPPPSPPTSRTPSRCWRRGAPFAFRRDLCCGGPKRTKRPPQHRSRRPSFLPDRVPRCSPRTAPRRLVDRCRPPEAIDVSVCPDCGNENEDGRSFCQSCGTFLKWTGESGETAGPTAGPKPTKPTKPAPKVARSAKPSSSAKPAQTAAATPAAPPPAEAAPTAGPPPPAPHPAAAYPPAPHPPPYPAMVPPPAAAPYPPPPGPPPAGPPPSPPTGTPEAAAPKERRKRASVLVAKAGSPKKTKPPKEAPDAAAAGSTTGSPEAEQASAPAPVPPGPPQRRRRKARAAPAPPKEKAPPGSLYCGECGLWNSPDRQFCRQCGTSLAEAPVASTPWWRRLFSRRRRAAPAGTRPRRPRATGRAVGRTFRLLVLGAGVAGVFVLLGPMRDEAMSGARGLWNQLDPREAPVQAVEASASSQLGDHRAEAAIDLKKGTSWAEDARGSGKGESIRVRFASEVRLTRLIVTPGISTDPERYLAQPRPRDVLVTVSSGGRPQLLRLEDKPGAFQAFSLDADDVRWVELEIRSVYPAQGGKGNDCAIDEIEFRGKD